MSSSGVNARDFISGKLAGLREAEQEIRDLAREQRLLAHRWQSGTDPVCRAVGEHFNGFALQLDDLASSVGRRAVEARKAAGGPDA